MLKKNITKDYLRFVKVFEHIIGLALMLLICLFIIGTINLDDIILLENRNPTYWELLNSDNSNTYFKVEGIDKVVTSTNLFDTWIVSHQINNVIFKGKDKKTLLLYGNNYSDDIYEHITGVFSLEDGEYEFYLDDAVQNEFIDVYVDAQRLDGGVDTLAFWGENAEFNVKNKLYSQIGVCVRIKNGFDSDGYLLKPVIIDKMPYEMVYMSDNDIAERSSCQYRIYNLTKDEYNKLTDGDRHLFQRIVRTYLKEDQWITLCFEDNTGIEIKDGFYSYGSINQFGQIVKLVDRHESLFSLF